MKLLGHPVTTLIANHIIIAVVTHSQLTSTLAKNLLNDFVLISHVRLGLSLCDATCVLIGALHLADTHLQTTQANTGTNLVNILDGLV